MDLARPHRNAVQQHDVPDTKQPRRASVRRQFSSHEVAPLIFSITTPYRIEQLLGIVSDTVLEDDFDVFDIRDASGRITSHHHEVGVFASQNRADLILAAEIDSTVQSRDPNSLDRWEPGIYQQLDLPLIPKA